MCLLKGLGGTPATEGLGVGRAARSDRVAQVMPCLSTDLLRLGDHRELQTRSAHAVPRRVSCEGVRCCHWHCSFPKVCELRAKLPARAGGCRGGCLRRRAGVRGQKGLHQGGRGTDRGRMQRPLHHLSVSRLGSFLQ